VKTALKSVILTKLQTKLSWLLFENLYFTTVGSIQYKQYNNRIREEKVTYIKKLNYVKYG